MLNWIRKKIITKSFYIDFESKLHESLKYEMKHDHLLYCILNSNKNGVTEESICNKEVIVSLTSYGKRLYDVAFTIESIMQGSILPNRIILWIEEGLKNNNIPNLLEKQKKRGLEIKYYKDIRSYKKIIPTLEAYPESCIITIDDDVLYEYDLVERLVTSYRENPNHIHACRARKMIFSSSNHLISYLKWPLVCNGEPASNKILQTGVGGVLYPPHSLHEDVLDEKTYMELSPYGDDLWLYIMAIRNGYKIHKIDSRTQNGEDYLVNDGVQDIALCNQNCNIQTCKNDVQLSNLFEKYGMYDFLNK